MIAIVIPVYNSAPILSKLYKEIHKVMSETDEIFRVVFVDDLSIDESRRVLYHIKKKYDETVSIIFLKRNVGQQNALLCGLSECDADMYITMDDDLQHDVSLLPKLIEEKKKGFDCVYAVPKSRKHNISRRFISYLNDKLFCYLLKKDKGLKITSYRVIGKELRDEIILNRKQFIYLSAVILNKTKNISQLYYDHKERYVGYSNYTLWKLLKLFISIWIYYYDSSFTKRFRKDGIPFEIVYSKK